jgi:hypothetical protein
MRDKKQGPLAGALALVTGASSGFGADFARILAGHGCELVLVARREDRLKALADELARDHGATAHVIALSLSAPGGCEALADRIEALGKPVDVLVNNAGFGLHGEFLDQPWERQHELLQLDIVSLVQLTRIFGPGMRARGHGWILLVSSIGAFQATPTYAIYSAAKSFVLSFGEALAAELAGTGVRVSTVCPGVAATEFIETAGQRKTLYQRLNMMKSRAVAEAGIQAMLAGKPCRIPGLQNSVPVFLLRFAPRRVATFLAGLFMRND